jgi:hypothetical protein
MGKLTFVHARGVVHCRDIVASREARAIERVVLGGSGTGRKSECQSDKIARRPHGSGCRQWSPGQAVEFPTGYIESPKPSRAGDVSQEILGHLGT